jgi:DNA-directed RNA polymerase specialized sigma24 family protein
MFNVRHFVLLTLYLFLRFFATNCFPLVLRQVPDNVFKLHSFFVLFPALKTTPPYSDPELVELLANKEPEACAYLYEKYAGALQGLIAQVIPEPHQQALVLQEVFLTICNRIQQYDPSKCRLFTWMINITRDVAIHKRGQLRISGTTPDMEENSGLGALTKKLSREDEQLIHLSWFKGYSTEEVAHFLNIPVDLAKSKIRSALSRLSTLL